jgi:2-polyprenyl-6-methoxyphenol hydroxylase-like FAD-dependent oxidoreductase
MPSSHVENDSGDRIPVLVVGAGPSGLVLALELARRNIGVRIVEAASAPLLASRAKGLQPRTLEIFDDLGLIDAVREDGGEFPRWRSYDGARLLWEKAIWELLGRGRPVATAARPYPGTWMIPQWRTEDILRNALLDRGVAVEFGTEFLWSDEGADGVTAMVRKNGAEQKIDCRYLVGADGAHSAVRKALGIDFVGETSASELYLIADVKADALEPGCWMNWAPGGDTNRRLSLCPLPRSDYFQFVAPLPPDQPVPELSLATLQTLFDERTGRSDMLLSDARWIVSHRPNTRLAEDFRDGSVFLVGDAAHSAPTSPGQGLNISVQDAYNLGWKLAAVLHGANPALLNTYEEERRPIAAGVLGVLTNALVQAGLPVREAETRQATIRDDIFHLDHNYRDSSLSLDRANGDGLVRAGDRAPDGSITGMSGRPVRLFDLLRGTHLLVLNFVSGTNDLASALAPQPGLRVVVVPPTAANHAIRRAFGVGDGPVQFLIRPDGYIAVRSARVQDLEDWLHRVFG